MTRRVLRSYWSALTVGTAGTVIFADPPRAGATILATESAEALQAGGVAAVPEPGTLAPLSVAGIVAAAAVWRRRKGS